MVAAAALIPFAVVLTTASPALAGGCVNDACGVLNNQPSSQLRIVGTNQWCEASDLNDGRQDGYANGEYMPGCPADSQGLTYYFVSPGASAGGISASGSVDIDAYRADANCDANIENTQGNVINEQTWEPLNRRGKGAQWQKFIDGTIFWVDGKTCYAPTGLTVGTVTASSVTIIWDALPFDNGQYDNDVQWRIRRNGQVLTTAPISANAAGRVVFIDTGLASSTTYTYTVAIFYGISGDHLNSENGEVVGQAYEGPQTTPRSATTQAAPPPSPSTCTYRVTNGYVYAGYYNGTTTQPPSNVSTAAGREAQCLLSRFQRYNPGAIDGMFGPKSQAAARAFQTDMNVLYGAGLSVDGLVGPHTWPWLRWYQSAYDHSVEDSCRPPNTFC